MKPETIKEIEKQYPNPGEGLKIYIFNLLTGGDFDNLFELTTFENNSCTAVLKGTASKVERREQFLKIYEGCNKIAEYIKKDVNYNSNNETTTDLTLENITEEQIEEMGNEYAKQFDFAEDSSPCVDFVTGFKKALNMYENQTNK